MTTPSRVKDRSRGFTLVEVMVSALLMGFIMLGILTTFLFMGRSGANLGNYSDMESTARKALERFAEDVRQATDVSWSTAAADQYTTAGVSSPTKVTLTVSAVSGNYQVTYWWDSTRNSKSSPPVRPFYRQVYHPDTNTTDAAELLLRQVDVFQFLGYQIVNPTLNTVSPGVASMPIDLSSISTNAAAATSANKLTKQIQISLRMSRTDVTVAAATNSVLSARYILRNKLIVN